MGRHRELGTAGEVIRQVVERDLSDWLSFLPQVFSLVLRYSLKEYYNIFEIKARSALLLKAGRWTFAAAGPSSSDPYPVS